MAYSETSVFPSNIDQLDFISDPDYAHKNIIDTHRGYIANGQYTAASNYINSQSGITPVNASLLNMIQNRTIALQEYLLTIPDSEKVKRFRFQETDISSTLTDGGTWISSVI